MTTPFRSWQLLLWPDAKPLELALVTTVIDTAQRFDQRIPPLQIHHLANPLPAISPDQRLWLLCGSNPPPLATSQQQWLERALTSGQPLVALHQAVKLLADARLTASQPLVVDRELQPAFSRDHPTMEISRQLFAIHPQITSGCGAFATLDLALALVALDYGEAIADQVATHLHAPLPRPANSLQRAQNGSPQAPPKAVQEAVALMRSNIEEPLSSDELATHAGVSRRQLERLFKQHLQQVPGQYYLELRLQKARELLLTSGTSIIQIGLSCGFSSGPHFSSAYRNFFGITPRDERAKRLAATGGGGGERG